MCPFLYLVYYVSRNELLFIKFFGRSPAIKSGGFQIVTSAMPLYLSGTRKLFKYHCAWTFLPFLVLLILNNSFYCWYLYRKKIRFIYFSLSSSVLWLTSRIQNASSEPKFSILSVVHNRVYPEVIGIWHKGKPGIRDKITFCLLLLELLPSSGCNRL